MKIDKARLKKNAIKIGLDAGAIIILGIASVAVSEIVPVLKDLEVFVAVTAGIWGWVPLKGLLEKLRK